MEEAIFVTPFGECGLKLSYAVRAQPYTSHSLRGVWIEITKNIICITKSTGHSLRGVWIEIVKESFDTTTPMGHSLRGVWIQISSCFSSLPPKIVIPFGEYG